MRNLVSRAFFVAALFVPCVSMASSPVVRVLLYEGKGPVTLSLVDGIAGEVHDVNLRLRDGALEMDGRRGGARQLFESPKPIVFQGARYRGQVEVRRIETGLAVINRVPLERYVEGALFQEAYTGWEEQALCAQAIAVRTYALLQMEKRRGEVYDLVVDTGSQMYGGVGEQELHAAKIVQKTQGEYVSYLGKPILAVYHASAGGQTAAAEEVWGRKLPYLVSLPVKNEWDAPDAYWRVEISRRELEKVLKQAGFEVGALKRVEVRSRSASGRVGLVKISGSRKSVEVEGRRLRVVLGNTVLRSTLFEVREGPDGEFVFVGSGYGHGVGMSQWGAQAMAERGASYKEILSWFYPGTRLMRLP